ncbi:T6SS immunity protein Tdi1 domain-containing protein [Litorisediminicola beolgyonensis]|uniref:T6SS immunity protein Tdi1 domain-containing protein n=1 Tax=Litorisediminicola beolgyonensis TaxID=1173614 RepID=A0ABW3ZFG7_9RHOB
MARQLPDTEPPARDPDDATVLAAVAEAWEWTGIEPARLLARNAFGNLLIEDRVGTTWRIVPEELACEPVADSAAERDALLSEPGFVEDWEMLRLVTVAIHTLGAPAPGRVFHLVHPAPLGGDYTPENMRIVPLLEQISFSGEVALQIRDLPDGAEVRLRVIE